MDLTVRRHPFELLGAWEAWYLKRRAEREGPSSSDYERDDTLANLAVGTLRPSSSPSPPRALAERSPCSARWAGLSPLAARRRGGSPPVADLAVLSGPSAAGTRDQARRRPH